MSGLAALVARGERVPCKRVVGGLARAGADCAHRAAAAAAPTPTFTPLAPPGPAPASSAASGRWGVVPGWKPGEGGEAVCAPPSQPACGGGLYAGPSPQLDWWMELYHGQVAVCCHADMDWYESFPPRARWSLSSGRARFFETAAAGVCEALILCTHQSAVSLGRFWAMTRSCPMIRSVTTWRSPSSWEDLDARRSTDPGWFGPRDRSLLLPKAGFGLSVQVGPRGLPA